MVDTPRLAVLLAPLERTNAGDLSARLAHLSGLLRIGGVAHLLVDGRSFALFFGDGLDRRIGVLNDRIARRSLCERHDRIAGDLTPRLFLAPRFVLMWRVITTRRYGRPYGLGVMRRFGTAWGESH